MEFWIKTEECTGCSACASVCQRNAIQLRCDENGYLCPVIHQEMCTDCGGCAATCPVLKRINGVPAADETECADAVVYAAWSRDEEIRMGSSSGGIFSELAKAVLDRRGVVCGAGYDDDNLVCHKIVTSEEALVEIRQSKYVQSQMNEIFRDVQSLLKSGTQVLFCGTACQVAGLYSFLGSTYENLVTVDFICLGVNSSMAYRAWLTELEQEYGAKATSISFRNKEDGWSAQSTRIDFANGAVYRKNRYEDLFKRAFLRYRLMLRPSCAQCRFKDLKRQADVTLGDFWSREKKQYDSRGISVVLINSEKGKELFSQIEQQIEAEPCTYQEVLRGNFALRQNVSLGDGWEEFLALLRENVPFSQAYRKVTNEDEPLMGEITMLEKDRGFLKNKTERLEKSCQALTEKTTGLEKDRTFLKNKAERLEKSCQVLTEKTTGLEKDRTFLKNKAERLEERCQALTEKTARLEKDRTFLANKSERLEKRCQALTEKATGLEKDRAFLANKSERLEKRCQALTEKATGLEKDRAFLKNKAERLGKDCMELENTIVALKKDRSFLKNRTARLEKDRDYLKGRLGEYQGALLARVGLKIHRLYRRLKSKLKRILHKNGVDEITAST